MGPMLCGHCVVKDQRSSINKEKKTYKTVTSSSPVKSDGVAWVGIRHERCRAWTRTACKCRVVGAFIGILRVDLTNDAWIRRSPYSTAFKDFALYRDSPENAMGRHARSGEERKENQSTSRKLHRIRGVELLKMVDLRRRQKKNKKVQSWMRNGG